VRLEAYDEEQSRTLYWQDVDMDQVVMSATQSGDAMPLVAENAGAFYI